MTDYLLLIGLLTVAIGSAIRDIIRWRQIEELREQLKPFAAITAEAIKMYESRKGRHKIEDELQAENNLIARVKSLLRIDQ